MDSNQRSKIQNPANDITSYINRLGQMQQERASWWSHYQELSNFILPRSGRFFVQDRNRGERKNNSIYDSTATRSLRVLAAGIMSGATSPARPWFRYATQDPEMMNSVPVKIWLEKATRKALDICAKSNTYRALHSSYEELGVFGTHLLVKQENFENVINLYPSTCGEYYLGKNALGEVDTFYREFQMQVSGMVDPRNGFGYDKCSREVQNLYDQGSLDKWVSVIHAVEPRYDRDPKGKDSKNKPWASMYFERSQSGKNFLREGGFDDFPGLAPRWQVSGGDIYGNSPGMEALGDIKQLQHEQLRKAQGIDYMTKPPLQLPTSMKGREHETLPGGTAYYDQATPNGGIRSQFEVKLDLNALLMDIGDVRERIKSAFYTDLFIMTSDPSETRMTATEVAERHEEKLLMLGPVLERMHNELFAPLIEYIFTRMIQTGVLPPPPPELQGTNLNIEFISMLAQAQQAVQTNGIDRFVANMGTLVQFGKSDVLDKFDSDRWAEVYSDSLGIDPSLIVADDKVALIRQSRAQAQQQQMASEQMAQAAQSAQKLGSVDTSKKNLVTDVMAGLTGYSTPSQAGTVQGA